MNMKKLAVILLVVISFWSSCGLVAIAANDLPGKGEIVTAGQLLQLAVDHGQQDIADKLRTAAPSRDFVSDGCSGGWPDVWHGVSIYGACFWHDVRYYLGGSTADKLWADAWLMLDVCESTGDPHLAVTMFNGVWLGGNIPASWQWGKVGVQRRR